MDTSGLWTGADGARLSAAQYCWFRALMADDETEFDFNILTEEVPGEEKPKPAPRKRKSQSPAKPVAKPKPKPKKKKKKLSDSDVSSSDDDDDDEFVP